MASKQHDTIIERTDERKEAGKGGRGALEPLHWTA